MTPVFTLTDPLPWIVVALAVWRISNLFVNEAGPWHMFTNVRRKFGVKHDEYDTPVAWPDGSVFECLWCFSLWVALLLAIVPWWFSTPFALSAVAVVVHKYVKG